MNIQSIKHFFSPLKLFVTALIILVVAGLAYHHYHKTVVAIPAAATKVTIPTQSSASSTKVTVPSSASAPSSPTSSGSSSTNQELVAPFGSFVSNHHPSAGSYDESSLCNTTSGATCYIQFTQGSDVKKLSSQTATNGSVVWDWNINSAGLGSGQWQVTAVATLNGQTKTTDDPIKLVVP